jgi:general secretion pathway protein G
MAISRSSRRRRDRGFTLIEVLMVLAILVIIAGLAVTNLFGLFASGKIKAAKAQCQVIETALNWYRLEWGTYPPSLEVLMQPAQTPDGRMLGGMWLERPPIDPWGRPFQYSFPSAHGLNKPDIWCIGEDGNPIGNWEM